MVRTRIGFWIGAFPVQQQRCEAFTYEAQRQCPRE